MSANRTLCPASGLKRNPCISPFAACSVNSKGHEEECLFPNEILVAVAVVATSAPYYLLRDHDSWLSPSRSRFTIIAFTIYDHSNRYLLHDRKSHFRAFFNGVFATSIAKYPRRTEATMTTAQRARIQKMELSHSAIISRLFQIIWNLFSDPWRRTWLCLDTSSHDRSAKSRIP